MCKNPVNSRRDDCITGVAQLLLAYSAISTQTISRQNEAHRILNIILVRGAWADGSGWKVLHDILVKHGYNVSSALGKRACGKL